MILRPYQEKAIEDTRKASAICKRVMLQLPTGAGKTLVASQLIRSALDKGNRVAFLVPYLSLINQTYQSFRDAGIEEIGVIQADHPLYEPSAPVQICSVDTLDRRSIFPAFEVLIVDEGHINRGYVNKWIEKFPDHHLIGLSATPWSEGLGKTYQLLVIGGTTEELIDAGFLAPFRVYAPSKPDLEGLYGKEYNQKELAKRVRKRELIADIVDTWLEKSTHEKTIGFAVNRAHAKELREAFQSRGIESGYIDAHTPAEERERIRRLFHEGEIKIVWNVGCLVAGVDWDVRTLILATPTKSEIKYVQMVGRALRTAPGKDCALILDHSDTTSRLGFVTDIHHSHLDTGLKKSKSNNKKEVLPKPCPNCGALKTTKVCHSCGFESIPQSHVENKDGFLVLQTGPTEEEKEQLWAELLWYANHKGYKQGWVWHKAEKLLGVPKNQNLQPIQASLEVRQQLQELSRKQRAHYHIKKKAKERSSGGSSTQNSSRKSASFA